MKNLCEVAESRQAPCSQKAEQRGTYGELSGTQSCWPALALKRDMSLEKITADGVLATWEWSAKWAVSSEQGLDPREGATVLVQDNCIQPGTVWGLVF